MFNPTTSATNPHNCHFSFMISLSILSNLWEKSLDSVDSIALNARINTTHRESVLKWLFESLDLLHVPDGVFFASVVLADRYSSKVESRRRLEGSELQLVILSSLCCCLKTVDASIDLSVKAFLEHVSGGHVDAKDIFQTEAKLLQALEFNAFTPCLSVYVDSFYNALCLDRADAGPLEQRTDTRPLPEWAQKQRYLTLFLLYLCVFDIERLHSQSPAELTATCILTSAYICSNQDRTPSEAPEWERIVENLVSAGWVQGTSDLATQISDLIVFWQEAVDKSTDAVESCIKLFDCKERFHVSRISPGGTRFTVSGG